MRFLLALLMPLAAQAQSQDMGLDQNYFPLALIVSAGLALLYVREAYAKNSERGLLLAVGFCAFAVACIYFPPLRLVLWALLAVFMVVGLLRAVR